MSANPPCQIALPQQLPTAEWDGRRGLFRVDGNPEWERVRAAYDRQLLEPAPLVETVRTSWRDRLRRVHRLAAWALHVVLVGRP